MNAPLRLLLYIHKQFQQADEYEALTEQLPFLRVGKAPHKARVWMLTLDNK